MGGVEEKGGDGENEGGEGGGGGGGEKASCGDVIMHVVTLPWKVMFASVPPPGLAGVLLLLLLLEM